MAELVWVRDAAGVRLAPCQLPRGSLVRDLLPVSGSGRPRCDFYVKCNGRRVSTEEELQYGAVYSVEPRLCGGKGGFGSMLRALGAQIEKTTNREACRDLSGRRLRDVNHEKAMAEWIKKQADREAEKEQRHMERLKRKLAEPKHYFNDPEYDRQCTDMSERMEDAVIQGLQAASSRAVSADSGDSRKRRNDPGSSKGQSDKKKCLWSGVEGLDVSSSSSSSSESSSDSDSESPCTSASCGNTVSGLHSSESSCDGAAQGFCVTAPSEPSAEEMETESSIQGITGVEQPTCDGGQTAYNSAASLEPDNPAAIRVVEESVAAPEPDNPAAIRVVEESVAAPEPDNPATIPAPVESTTTPEPENPATTPAIEESAVTPEPTQSAFTPETQQKPPHTDSASFDLLAFTSAAEMEALGLDKLKLELMAMGLKCGGTLQERAARLFSVRGLSREQIDPALFPKPSKGKKR
ncbi:splicing regulator SDE2 [Pseudophryne corroboree]|uniref:splicing regulator SDE2 n=1 Tax=Pseudophryne corroboree TaxID=495146 RepID=UPI003081F7E4